MKIALFSDTHGRLRIVLHILQCWMIEHETKLDAALLAGDIGCFPELSRMDRATRSWAKKDPEESGFSTYFTKPKASIVATLEGRNGTPDNGRFSAIDFPILFVPGNHEDYKYIETCAANGPVAGMSDRTFPVDCYQKIHCIRNGEVAALKCGKDAIRIAGLWGVENRPDADPSRISDVAVSRLTKKGPGGFDLLLTHDTPSFSYPGLRSSTKISVMIKKTQPPFHVFGHEHPIEGRHDYQGEGASTVSWIFNDVCFGKKLNKGLDGCMGILTWTSYGGGNVEVVRDPWLRQMRFNNWNRVWPAKTFS